MSITLYPTSVKFNDNGTYRNIASAIKLKLTFTDVTVPSSAFASDSTYEDYSYCGSIQLPSVESSMIPEVIFGMDEAVSGNFAPISESYNGGVYIYTADIPENSITIPTIMCWYN